MITNPEMTPRRSWLLVATAIFFLSVALFSIYYALSVSRLKKEVATLEENQKKLSQSSTEEGATPEGRFALTTIKDRLAGIESNQLFWSKIIEKIEATVPKNPETKEPVATIRSYTGSNDGRISANGITKESSADPFADVAELIAAFGNETTFKNVFVPSITKNVLQDGSVVLSFSLTFDYHKQTF